jgi:hypothetical protein
MSNLDDVMPKLTELELARILDHFRDCGADPKAIKRISGHITRLAMEGVARGDPTVPDEASHG